MAQDGRKPPNNAASVEIDPLALMGVGASHLYARRSLDSFLMRLIDATPPKVASGLSSSDPVHCDWLRQLTPGVAITAPMHERLSAVPVRGSVPDWLAEAWDIARAELLAWYPARGFSFMLEEHPDDPGDATDASVERLEYPAPDPQTRDRRLIEHLKCWADPVYFVDSFCALRHPSRGTIPFRLWEWQAWLLDQFRRNKQTIVLKARQLGASELAAAIGLWDIRFFDTKTVLMISKGDSEAKALLERTGYMYSHLPRWLKCGAMDEDRVTPLGVDAVAIGAVNMSTFQIIHVTSQGSSQGSVVISLPATMGTGRSRTGSRVILDEWAHQMWQDAIWSAIEPTIDAGGQLIGISTANGLGNLFHGVWEASTKAAAAVKVAVGAFVAVFLPWHRHPDRDQEWYDNKEATYSGANKLHLFHQEYPRNAVEAFIQSGRPVFSQEYLTIHAQRIDAELEERRTAGLPLFVGTDGITIYEDYDPNKHYLLAADVAEGLADGDFDDACLYERERRIEVAHLHGRWPPEVYADKLAELGMCYGGAELVVERNNHGAAILLRLRHLMFRMAITTIEDAETGERTQHWARIELGVPQAYPKIYHYKPPLVPGQRQDIRPGWLTNVATKPLMIDALALGLREQFFFPRYMPMLEEALIFSYDDKGSMNAPEGYHDDTVMSAAMAAFVLTQPSGAHQALAFVQARQEQISGRVEQLQLTAGRSAPRSGIVLPPPDARPMNDPAPATPKGGPVVVGSL